MSNPREAPETEVLLALNRSATTARLLSGVVHELNNVLQVISGTVELLEVRADLPPTARPALERVRNQSARAAATLSDVLQFTRASLDERTRVNLLEVAQHSVNLRMFAVRRAGLHITITSAGDSFLVVGNRGMLQQAILNIIANAEQALAPQKKGAIQVHLDVDAASVTLRVSDEGPGIPMTPPEMAFEPFVTTREPWEGSGLGLWAARQIAAAHEGSLQIEDGARSAFVLRLKRAP